MDKHTDLKIVGGKNHLQAMPPGFLWEIGAVMTHGDTKYAPENWKGGKDHPLEYIGAAFRHFLRYWAGEKRDPETGLHHLAHMVCSLMFLFWFDEGDSFPMRTCHCQHCNK